MGVHRVLEFRGLGFRFRGLGFSLGFMVYLQSALQFFFWLNQFYIKEPIKGSPKKELQGRL